MRRSPQQPGTPSRLSDSLHHQLNMYALAASAAGVGVLALAQPAEARIVYTHANKKIPFCSGHQNLCFKLDLNHDGVADFRIIRVGYGDFYSLGVRPLHLKTNNRVWGGNSGSRRLAYALSSGVKVGPNSLMFEPLHYSMWGYGNFSTGPNSWGQWQNVQNKYLGLKFSARGKVHYGWARLSTTPDTVLTGYAYETIPNRPIITGKTRRADVTTLESGSLGTLAAGASRRAEK
jgi:hypothetical protein